MRNSILLLTLAALMLPACALMQTPDEPAPAGPPLPNSGAFRAGVMYLMDSDWDDIDAKQVVPSLSLEYRRRIDDEGRFSIATGLDFQWNSADFDDLGVDVDVDAYLISVPILFGVNSTTNEEWKQGKANFFGGIGIVGVLAYYEAKASFMGFSDTDSDLEYGLGPVVNAAVQVPLGSPDTFFIADVRYSWKAIDSDGPINDVGGLEATIGIGISF